MSEENGITSFSLDDEESKAFSQARMKSWKGTAGVTYRMAVCWFKKDAEGNYDFSKPRFDGGMFHGYKEGVGYVMHQGKGTEALLGEPKPRAATFIVVYGTDNDGEIQKSLGFGFEVWPWVLPAAKLAELKRQHKKADGGLGNADLEVICEDSTYQKLKIDRHPEAVWRKKPAIMEAVFAKVEAMESKIPGLLGRTMSIDEIKEKLGMEVGGSVTDAVSDDGFDDLLDGVGADT